MENETTNTRFAKNRFRKNATEQDIAAKLEYFESSDVDDDDDFSASHSRPHAATNRTSATYSRMTSLDGHPDQGCTGNCSNMFCGPGHFKKQERIMRKFVRDPSINTNQEGGSGSGSRFGQQQQTLSATSNVG